MNVISLPTVKPSVRSSGRNRPEQSAKHDELHMVEGLRYCWCKCRNCWRPSFAVNNRHTGHCICPDCPCRDETAKALGKVGRRVR